MLDARVRHGPLDFDIRVVDLASGNLGDTGSRLVADLGIGELVAEEVVMTVRRTAPQGRAWAVSYNPHQTHGPLWETARVRAS